MWGDRQVACWRCDGWTGDLPVAPTEIAYAVFGEWVLYREVSEVRELRPAGLWGRSQGAAGRQELSVLLGLVRGVGSAAGAGGRAHPHAYRASGAADRGGAEAAAEAQRAAGHGDDEHPGFDDGVDLPGDGHPADEDV